MLREEIYISMARIFGCSIGVAQYIAPPSNQRIARGVKRDDIGVNKIIAEVILDGGYKNFRRKVLAEEKARDKREKESTFYKKIWNGSTPTNQ
jgi:hypothetical protein